MKIKNLEFLGYHSSKADMESGFKKGIVSTDNEDNLFMIYHGLISDSDEVCENLDYDTMAERLEEEGYFTTYVSEEPIKSTPFQYTTYKYGNFLYKVYGDGSEFIFDDFFEQNASIIVSKKPLYFEKVSDSI